MTLANATPYVAMDVPWLDETGREVVIAVVKATFTVLPTGKVVPADRPSGIRVADEPWDADAKESSVRHPADVGLARRGTDVVVNGAAILKQRAAVADVTLQARDHVARLRVHGERPFYVAVGELRMGAAKPFERMPIVYERAYGGTAKSLSLVELGNPIGTGVFDSPADVDGTLAPQIEDPAEPYVAGAAGRVAGMGAIPRHWEPRRTHAGTFDDAWRRTRMPLQPLDRDPRHENVAAPSLVVPEPLRGGDAVRVTGMTESGSLVFTIPTLRLVIRGVFDTGTLDVRPDLDLLLIEPEAARLELTARAVFPIGRARQVLREIRVDTEAP